ncbi:mRNA turnover 4 [Lambiella insularis]|nr:mRNA turnover 4 [Lambiella insularis]
MPRSKRAKVVHLSKVTKKGKELTLKTFANIQECVSKYPYLFVFSVDNMRNTYLKDVRTQLADSRLFFGKTKVMAAALGRSATEEPAPNTSLLAPYLAGTIGLIFTPRTPLEMQKYFSSFHPLDYARAGTVARRTFVLPPGTVYSRGGEIPSEEDVPLAHSIEPTLRKLGVPSRLVKGKIELEGEYVVCQEGEVLGSGQTTLLKMFGIATAEFGVELKAFWEKKTGGVVVLAEGEAGGGGMDVDAGEELDDEE